MRRTTTARMRTILLAACLALTVAPGMLGQAVFLRGVVNAGSFMSPALPGGALPQGGIFTIFGRDIGPEAGMQVSQFPLQDQFGGVSIQLTQGDRTVNAIPIFVSRGQINAILRSTTPLGTSLLRVTFEGRTSNPVPVQVVRQNVGVFTVLGAGIGPGVFQNFVSQTEQPINTWRATARPGQIVTLWLTGLGPIAAADNVAPPVGDLPVEVEIFVGDRPVTAKLYSGRAPCCAGVDQIVFALPEDAPEGCFVPVRVRVAGTAVSNTVTIAIRRGGGECRDPDNPFVETLLKGGRFGLFVLARNVFVNDVGSFNATQYLRDRAYAYFIDEPGGELAFNPKYAFPPAGACTAYAMTGNLLAGRSNPFARWRGLDAGAVSVQGPNGERTIARQQQGQAVSYAHTTVGGSQILPRNTTRPLYLDPGSYTLRAAGAAAVGAITRNVDVGGPVNWSNRASFATLRRDRPVRFEWGPQSGARVVVGGVQVDVPGNATSVFFCVVPAGASSFEAPAVALANFPASRGIVGQSVGYLFVATLPGGAPSLLTAEGLAGAAGVFRHLQFKAVRFE